MELKEIRDGSKYNRLLCRIGFSEHSTVVEIKNGQRLTELWIFGDQSHTVHTKII